LLRTPPLLRQLVEGLPERALSFHPLPGKWCIKEVIGHLIEEDRRDFVGRARLMLKENEPDLPMNDQDEVARTRHDCNKNAGVLLAEFESTRSQSTELIGGLAPGDLERGGIHPRIGRITVQNLLQEWLYHDLNHMKQIGSNCQAFLWDGLGSMQQFYRS
jgi:DinB superfamily